MGNTCSQSEIPVWSPSVQKQSEKFKKRRLNDLVYECVPAKEPHAEIVFFHGLHPPEPEQNNLIKGLCCRKRRRCQDEVQPSHSRAEHDFWRSWKVRNSEEFWPETLLPRVLSHHVRVRVLCVAYQSKCDLEELGKEESDEYLLGERLIQNLIHGANVGKRKNVPVFLVGHDLGGILIKSFVLAVEDRHAKELDIRRKIRLGDFLSNLKAVFFYATPHCGSTMIKEMAKKIPKDTQNHMLRLMGLLNAETARVNSRFRAYRKNLASKTKSSRITTIAIHPTHKTYIPGRKEAVMIVHEGSARHDVDQFIPVSADHYQVCQPDDEKSTAVICLKLQILAATSVATKIRYATGGNDSFGGSGGEKYTRHKESLQGVGRKLRMNIRRGSEVKFTATSFEDQG